MDGCRNTFIDEVTREDIFRIHKALRDPALLRSDGREQACPAEEPPAIRWRESGHPSSHAEVEEA
jgi:hypothetical protein